MSWMTDIANPATVRERTLKSLNVPVGLANPLWLAFGVAASAGAAWWMMARWANPFNAESVFGVVTGKATAAKAPPQVAPKAAEAIPVVPEIVLEAAPTIVEAVAAPVEAVMEAAPETLETAPEAAHETVAAEAAAVAETFEEAAEELEDDLTLLVGIGPRCAAALAERGVTRFAHLAAWTDEQLAAFDAELKLKGRSLRNQWRAQAIRLAAKN